MTAAESFLDELRERTEFHLRALAEESGQVFGRYLGNPELGQEMYADIAHRFAMDGAQEIGALLVRLVSGELDHGAIMLSPREYRGLRYVHATFSDRLDNRTAVALDDLVTTLAKADR